MPCRKHSPGNPCCDEECVTDCPTHVATASYTAVIGDHSITLTSIGDDCNFTGSDCIITSPTVTNTWEVLDSFEGWPSDPPCNNDEPCGCCGGSQVPGAEVAASSYDYVQTGYEQNDKYIRWEQWRERMTVRIYSDGGGNLRIEVTVFPEIIYLIGMNTAIRGFYRVCEITYCTDGYTDSAPTNLPMIPCSFVCASTVYDAWPTQPAPDYPPCNIGPVIEGCNFAVGSDPDPLVTTLELEQIGPFNSAVCDEPDCELGTFYENKAADRIYYQQCGGGIFTQCGVELGPSYSLWGPYYYYSDPFPCDAFPANPIALKREPYTDIATNTDYETVCGESFPYRFPAVPKDLNLTLT